MVFDKTATLHIVGIGARGLCKRFPMTHTHAGQPGCLHRAMLGPRNHHTLFTQYVDTDKYDELFFITLPETPYLWIGL